MALPPLPPKAKRKPWRRSHHVTDHDTLSETYSDRRYIAALAVVLVDLAQCIPYGTEDLTASNLNPWEWAVTLGFIAVTVTVALAAAFDRARLFAEAVYLSAGLYTITTMAILSAVEIRVQPRIMLATLCAGVTVGLFTLWMALLRRAAR